MTAKGTKELIKKESTRLVPPFADMERWFEDMWRRPLSLLGSSLWPELKVAERYEISPSVDIYETDDEVVFKADLPGVKKDELDVNVTENMLTISGKKEKEEKVERENYYRYERSHGSFLRKFELPRGIDLEKIDAHFEDGVLKVTFPKTEEVKKHTKKIEIK